MNGRKELCASHGSGLGAAQLASHGRGDYDLSLLKIDRNSPPAPARVRIPQQSDAENEMSESPTGGNVFDEKKIRRLIELMNEHDLNEIDLREGEVRVKLKKRGEMVMASAPAAAPHAAPAPAPAAAATATDNFAVIKSPMVGTFYTSPNPESPPFAKVGDHVGNETIVCVIEAMKVFNEIPAEMTGKVVACLVQNGSPVEFGQPLFKIDPKG
jgi:acetyl-CoA carboxylase biotin carboxyl carrier protein